MLRGPVCSKRTLHGALLMLLAGALAASSQAKGNKKLAPVYPIKDTMSIDEGLPILVLPPKVTRDSFRVGRQVRVAYINELSVTRWVHRIALGTLRRTGFLSSEHGASNTDEGHSAEKLIQLSDRLVRQRVPRNDLLSLLGGLNHEAVNLGVLVQHLHIKVAPKGSWNPRTGALAVGMSNSDLRGVILDRKTGEILWKGEMYIRMIPEVGNKRFENAVAGIFKNLTRRER